jgi:hypothetical protein
LEYCPQATKSDAGIAISFVDARRYDIMKTVSKYKWHKWYKWHNKKELFFRADGV